LLRIGRQKDVITEGSLEAVDGAILDASPAGAAADADRADPLAGDD